MFVYFSSWSDSLLPYYLTNLEDTVYTRLTSFPASLLTSQGPGNKKITTELQSQKISGQQSKALDKSGYQVNVR